ncbi:MAG: hypothetical protein HQK76_09865 [Desulfobacterales bacterium]|nr:hypothetical protein [Desulfobacterales bacterium]
MATKKMFILFIFLLLLFYFSSSGICQGLDLSASNIKAIPNIGFSIPSGDLDYLDPGLTFGVNLFLKSNPFTIDDRLLIGVDFGYCRWTGEKSYGIKWDGNTFIKGEIDYTTSIIKVLPSVRYILPYNDYDLFFQGGFGFFYIMTDVDAMLINYNLPDDDDTDLEIGLSFGIGTTINNIEILGLFHLTDGQFLSLTVGYLF